MGPDHIHNKMLTNLNSENQLALTHLINILFLSGYVPNVWKRATVVPLLKSGKDPSRTDSYRPISLTSCLAKVMERAINNRLHWYLDKNKYLPKCQTGFRKNCSTMDNIIKLESSIKSAFNHQKICTAVFLDLANAYPSTWITGITYKLTMMHVAGTMLRWLHHFLNDRKLQIKIGNTFSEERTTLKGVPQGCVLSPLLFNVMMSDFPQPPANCQSELFADDIEIHTITETKPEAENILQPFLYEIEDWARKWKLVFSIGKCASLTFSRRRSPQPTLKLNLMSSLIKEVKQYKFLGLIFDSKLSWEQHINEVNTCIQRRGNILKALTSKKTILSTPLLLRIYKALIRSKLDYGASALINIPNSRIDTLEKTQNQLLHIIFGCLKSTPKALLHIESDIPPVKIRWQMLAANYFLKLSNKPYNPAFKTIKCMKNFSGAWQIRSIPACIPSLKLIEKFQPNVFTLPHSNSPATAPIPPWKLFKIEIKLFPLSKTEAASNPSQTKIIFNKIIAPLNHPNHVIAYTDGSVHTSASSCAIYIPKLLIQDAWLLTKHTNIFNAELNAILQSLKALYSHDNFDEITIFSDSKSSIQAISNYRWDASPVITEIIQLIYNYREAGTNVTLYWIPSHCGIEGNCVADNLATSRTTALEGNILENELTSPEILNILKQKTFQTLLQQYKNCSSNLAITCRESLGPLSWHQHSRRNVQTSLFRLRSGHNRLNYFLAKWDKDSSPFCPHGCLEHENSQHVLLQCHYYNEPRKNLLSILSSNNIPPTLPTLLGLNTTIPKHTQEKIKSALVTFITQTELIKRI
jgi:ribonuclease HI